MDRKKLREAILTRVRFACQGECADCEDVPLPCEKYRDAILDLPILARALATLEELESGLLVKVRSKSVAKRIVAMTANEKGESHG